MKRTIVISALFFTLFIGTATLRGQVVPIQIVQQATATSQPTTQESAGDNKSLYDQLLKTQLAEIIQGKRQISLTDIRQPGFWIDNIKDLIVTLLAFIPRIIGTAFFLFVFWLIYRAIRRMAVGSMKQQEVDSSIRELLGSLIKWTVMGFGIVIACNQLGIPIVAMLTGVSIIGLAVGFAAQETLANFIAGIVIYLDKPLKIGDWIELNGTFGQVKRVSFRSTRLLSLDGDMHVLPNTMVLSTQLSNKSVSPMNRVAVTVGISYRSSIAEARRVLLEMVAKDSRICTTPAAEVIVKNLADSAVVIALRFWLTDESLEHRIVYEYNEKVKNALDAAGIEIPFPHIQLITDQPRKAG